MVEFTDTSSSFAEKERIFPDQTFVRNEKVIRSQEAGIFQSVVDEGGS